MAQRLRGRAQRNIGVPDLMGTESSGQQRMRADSSRSIGDFTSLSVTRRRPHSSTDGSRMSCAVSLRVIKGHGDTSTPSVPFLVVFDYRGITKGGRGPSFDPYTLHNFQAHYAAILLPFSTPVIPTHTLSAEAPMRRRPRGTEKTSAAY